MQPHANEAYLEIDDCLWPLTGVAGSISWQALVENLRIRARLEEIRAHVREMHVGPQLRRLGRRASPEVMRAVTESLIAGPLDGPPWLQTLRDPIPRALCEEWKQLTQRLQEIETRHKGQHQAVEQ